SSKRPSLIPGGKGHRSDSPLSWADSFQRFLCCSRCRMFSGGPTDSPQSPPSRLEQSKLATRRKGLCVLVSNFSRWSPSEHWPELELGSFCMGFNLPTSAFRTGASLHMKLQIAAPHPLPKAHPLTPRPCM